MPELTTSIRVGHCRFRFVCDRTWDSLDTTTAPDVRYCNDCQQRVYLCKYEEEWRTHVALDHCVAIPPGPLSHAPILGRPDDEDRACRFLMRQHLPPMKTLLGLKPGTWLWSGKFGMGRDSLEINVESETA